MSTDIVPTEQKLPGLREWALQPKIHSQLAAAVGDTMDADTFIAHMMVAFQTDAVRPCTDESKYAALHECAAVGLLPTLGQVVLIPYKQTIKVTIQWQGLKALMERHRDVLEVCAYLVHVGDDFELLNGELRHSYDPFDPKRTIDGPENLKGGYCKITYRDGRPCKYHVVTIRQISKAQQCAQTQKIWSKWYEQMALKTLYRDCYARRAVPMDPLANETIERTLRADDVDFGNDPDRGHSPNAQRHIEQAREQHAKETEAAEKTVEPESGIPEAGPTDDLPETPKPTGDTEHASLVAMRVDEFRQAFAEAGDKKAIDSLKNQLVADTVLDEAGLEKCEKFATNATILLKEK